jgi:phosphatidate cytidylyltransferase
VLTRALAAAVGLLLVVPAMVYGGPAGTTAVVAVAGMICVDEFARMALPDARWLGRLGVGLPLAAAMGAWGTGNAAILGVALGLVAVFGSVALRPGPDLGRAAERMSRIALGASWVGLIGFVPEIHRLGGGWLALVLVVSWCGDTGGYLVGRAFGRRLLLPAVSPKKTVEGAIGSLVAGAAGAALVSSSALSSMPMAWAAVVGVGLAAVAIVGDLAESLLKRAWGVKDTGGILPGHGGLLDRVDSVLFAAPCVYWVGLVFEGRT